MHIYLNKGTVNPAQDRLLKDGRTINVASQNVQCLLTEEEVRVIELSLQKIVDSHPGAYTAKTLWEDVVLIYSAIQGALEYGSERCEKLHQVLGALTPSELEMHNPPLPFEQDMNDDEVEQNILPFSKKAKR